jgi:hypothetical protein
VGADSAEETAPLTDDESALVSLKVEKPDGSSVRKAWCRRPPARSSPNKVDITARCTRFRPRLDAERPVGIPGRKLSSRRHAVVFVVDSTVRHGERMHGRSHRFNRGSTKRRGRRVGRFLAVANDVAARRDARQPRIAILTHGFSVGDVANESSPR